MPGAIKNTAHMYSIDPEQRRQWEKKLSSLKMDSGESMQTMLSSKGWTKKTFHKEKTCSDIEHNDIICSTFDAIQLLGHFVSETMLTIELKRNSGSLLPFHDLVQHFVSWLVSLGINQHCITHVDQNTWNCEKVTKDLVEGRTRNF